MREKGRAVLTILFLLVLFALMPAVFSQDNEPATVLQQILQRQSESSSKQDILINSINDLKIQIHDDLNVFITKEEFEQFKTEAYKKIDSKADLTMVVFASFVIGAFWFLIFLLFKGQGKM